MKRRVYFFLVIGIVASVMHVARAETMTERRQRIMRKYLRERQTIVQSDLVVPDAALEEAQVADSERFKEPQGKFLRQEGGMARPPAPRPAPVQAERSWWLDTADVEEDPFSSRSGTAEDAPDVWSAWNNSADSSPYGGSSAGTREDSYSGNRSGYDMQQASDNGSTTSGLKYGGYNATRSASAVRQADRGSVLYGRQQEENQGTGSGWGLNSMPSYGSSPSSGLLQSPYPSSKATQPYDTQNQMPGYTPYSSPYQNQLDVRGRNGGNLEPQTPQYSRPQPYQKWKDSNKTWDPTADDSYLEALMRDNRR